MYSFIKFNNNDDNYRIRINMETLYSIIIPLSFTVGILPWVPYIKLYDINFTLDLQVPAGPPEASEDRWTPFARLR